MGSGTCSIHGEAARVNGSALLAVDDLTVDFCRDGVLLRAVYGVAFSVHAGETVALVGESGAGKSAVALAVMGLLSPPTVVRGSVRFDGRELMGLRDAEYRDLRGRDLAIVFQDPSGSLNPSMRVGDQIAEALLVHGGGATLRAARVQAIEALTELGLPQPAVAARAFPHELSGGMQQRVMLAMALANRPRLLVADEPTTALDATTQAQVLDVLGRARRGTDLAILLVTHDLGLVAGLADRVLVLYAGRIVEEGSVDEVLRMPRHPYTIGLLGAVPRITNAKGSLPQIPGSAPVLGELPSGCAFRSRCWLADDVCAAAPPELRPVGASQSSACLHVDRLPAPVQWP